MKIAVAGATGRAGRHVVDVLEARGHDVVPMARSTGVDVITGDGLAAALDGVEVIVDLATGPSPDEAEATAFFTTAARRCGRCSSNCPASQSFSVIGHIPWSSCVEALTTDHPAM